MPTSQSTAQQLREALRPIWRRFAADRTISAGKLGILGHLERQGPTTASTLAASEKVSPQAITTAVREMETLGLIVRTPDENDRRRIWIEITETGLARLAAERTSGSDWLREAIESRLSAEQAQALHALIPILHKLVDDEHVN